jgi:hypothetical protein
MTPLWFWSDDVLSGYYSPDWFWHRYSGGTAYAVPAWDRMRAALEQINQPFDTTMTGLETATLLRAIARRALEDK